MENNLTRDEECLVLVLRKKNVTDMEDLLTALPNCTSHSISVRMKYLAAKLAPQGWIIERVSAIGRGNKARYSFQKKF